MKQNCPVKKEACHTCRRGECLRELDKEASLFGMVNRITRDIARMVKELKL